MRKHRMEFRGFVAGLWCAAILLSGLVSAAYAVDAATSQPPQNPAPTQKEAAPLPIPITDDLPPDVADLLRKAVQGDSSTSVQPLKPAAENVLPAKPEAGSAGAPPPPAVAPAVPPATPGFPPGAIPVGPGTSMQFLKGKLVKPDEAGRPPKLEPNAVDQPPAWVSDVLPEGAQVQPSSGALAMPSPLAPAATPSVVRLAAPVRQPTKKAPATPPANLAAPVHPTLVEAVKAGDIRDVETHILRGASLNAPDEAGDTPLAAAAAAGHYDILALLLDYGASPVKTSEKTNQPPLIAAASNSHWDCVQLLRDYGAAYDFSLAACYGDLQAMEQLLAADPSLIDEVDGIRNTVVHAAALAGRADVIEFFAAHGAALSMPNIEKDTPLAYAAQWNHAGVIKALAAAGVDMNQRLRGGATVLHRKVQANDTECVELILSLGGDINAGDDRGATPLHVAAQLDRPGMIAFLLDHGARIEGADKNGATALHSAAAAGAVAAVTALLDRGALIGALDPDGGTPLHAAAKAGEEKGVVALLDRGADLLAVNAWQATALHYAVEGAGVRPFGQDSAGRVTDNMEHRIELMELFISKGLKPDAADAMGMTPLHNAAQAGQRVLCVVLLRNGAQVNAQDSTGRTPLLAALEHGFAATAEALLNQGADIRIADNLGRTPLHVAVQTSNLEWVRQMMGAGADVNAVDSNGWTVLHYAAEKGPVDVVRLLLALGVPLDAADSTGRRALHLAAQRDDADVVKVLVGNGADVRAADFRGRQPIHMAAGEGRLEAVQALLQGGADANSADNSGYTALHIAAELGHSNLIRPLMLHRGNPNARAKDGRTPLQIAEARGDRQALSMLRSSASGEFEAALKEGDVEAVERLISQNRSLVNSRREGLTALHVASKAGNKEIVELLLGYGANAAVAESGKQRVTPLHDAAESGNLEIVQLLLMMGANPLARDAKDRFPADIAELNGHAEVATAIRARAEKAAAQGATVAARGQKPARRTLFSLIAEGNTEEFKAVLDEYAGVASRRFLSLAPIQLAATMGKKDILALLLERGADPNAIVDARAGRALLHEAASRGNTEIVDLLLSAGANPKAKDNNNKLPADLARENKFDELAKTLEERTEQETK